MAEEFVPLHLGSMPIAGAFMALDEGVQANLIYDVSEALEGYVQGDRIVYPDAVHVAVGYN